MFFFGVFWRFSEFFGDFRSFSVISGVCRLFSGTFGDFRSFSVFFTIFQIFSGYFFDISRYSAISPEFFQLIQRFLDVFDIFRRNLQQLSRLTDTSKATTYYPLINRVQPIGNNHRTTTNTRLLSAPFIYKSS